MFVKRANEERITALEGIVNTFKGGSSYVFETVE